VRPALGLAAKLWDCPAILGTKHSYLKKKETLDSKWLKHVETHIFLRHLKSATSEFSRVRCDIRMFGGSPEAPKTRNSLLLLVLNVDFAPGESTFISFILLFLP
jgi:hypothetical protein